MDDVADVVEGEVTDAEEFEPEVEEPTETEAEKEARALGWVPEDEFKGDPKNFRDVETFLSFGREKLGVARENVDRLTEKVTRLEEKDRRREKELRAAEQKLKGLHEHYQRVEENAYKRAMKEKVADMRAAVEDRDTDRFDRASQELDELEPPEPVVVEEPTPEETAKHEAKSIIDRWIEDNPWYSEDPDMHEYAFKACEMLARSKPGLVGRDQLDEAAAMVRKKFPEHFENLRRKDPAAVEGSRAEHRKKKGKKKTFKDLPPEAQDMCNSLVGDGHITQEAYIENYPFEE